MVERKAAPVITDNLGSQEMKQNADTDAAAAMSRVTGLSVVDNQYVFVRGLGERYSNTTLSGSMLPTTEPDKKVVPLDLFPAGLLDSVQVEKSYSPDRSAEFAGGLVQINPLKLPSRAGDVDFSYGVNGYSTATGKSMPLSPLGGRDCAWASTTACGRCRRAFPTTRSSAAASTRLTSATRREQITDYGRQLGNTWRPSAADGAPGQNWGAVFGNRFGKLGVVASVTQSYKEQYVEEERALLPHRRRRRRTRGRQRLRHAVRHAAGPARRRRQPRLPVHAEQPDLAGELLHATAAATRAAPSRAPTPRTCFYYRNNRLPFIEEGLMSNGATGDHFFPGLSNSRIDWRVNLARANRDEPDLRETLYQQPFLAGRCRTRPSAVLADESQSGFRMFNELDDETLDVAANWAAFKHDRRRGRRSSSSASTTSSAPATSRRAGSASSRSRDTRTERRRSACRRPPSNSSRRATSARRSASTRKRARSTPTTASRRPSPATA